MNFIDKWVMAAALAAGISGAARAAEITVTDDVKRQVTLNVPVKRVVAFNKYNADFFRAVGGQNVLVGMARDIFKLTNYWPGLGKEAVAGQNQREPNYEAIVGLNPDLVVSQN